MYQTFMPQQYQPYQIRQDFMSQQQPVGMTVRPVASRAESEAAQIPFDGSTHFFYDTSSGKIYAKTFNATNGTAPLVTFSRDVETPPPVPEYATMDTVAELRQIINKLSEEVDKMKKPGKAAKKDDAE